MFDKAAQTVIGFALLSAVITSLPARAVSSTYLLPSYRAAGITPSQEAQIQALMKPVDEASDVKRQKIVDLQKEVALLFRQANPDQSAVQRKVAEISRLKSEIATARSKLMLDIRKVLTVEQRDKLLYDRLLASYNKLSLTAEQKSKVRDLLRKQISDSDPLKTKILNLELECRKLELDSKADQDLVMQRQTQINLLAAQISRLELATSLAIRELLTADQLKKVYPNNNPADRFIAAKPTPEQIKKIEMLTKSYNETSTAQSKKLFPLINELSDLLAKPDLDEKTILAKQQEVNSLRSELSLAKAKLVCDLRAVFTTSQAQMLLSSDPAEAYQALNPTDAQKEQIRTLTAQYRKNISEKQQEMFNRQLDFDALASDPTTSEINVLDAQGKVVATQAAIDNLRRQFTLAVRGLLTQEQLDKLTVNGLLRNKLATSSLSSGDLHKISDTISRFRNGAIDRSEHINDVTSVLRDLAWQPIQDGKIQEDKEKELYALQSENANERAKLMVDLHNILQQTPQANADIDVFDLTN